MSITFSGVPTLTIEERASQVAYAKSLGLGGVAKGSGRLAVVGSGHSLPVYEETLRRWDGDVWAVNGAWKWCRDRGIKAAFFSVHPTPSILAHLDGIGPSDTAILAEQSCRDVLDKTTGSGAAVQLYDDKLYPGCASLTQAAYQGVLAGHSGATFFGSDLNFSEGKQHLTHEVGFRPLMRIKAGDMEYMTTPAYYAQALEIVNLVQAFPGTFRERSAGLLRALLEGPHAVLWLSDGKEAFDNPDLDLVEIFGADWRQTTGLLTLDRLDNINIMAAE